MKIKDTKIKLIAHNIMYEINFWNDLYPKKPISIEEILEYIRQHDK